MRQHTRAWELASSAVAVSSGSSGGSSAGSTTSAIGRNTGRRLLHSKSTVSPSNAGHPSSAISAYCPADACTSRLSSCQHLLSSPTRVRAEQRANNSQRWTRGYARQAPGPPILGVAAPSAPAAPIQRGPIAGASSAAADTSSATRPQQPGATSTAAALSTSASNAAAIAAATAAAAEQQEKSARELLREVWSQPAYQARYRSLDPPARLAREDHMDWRARHHPLSITLSTTSAPTPTTAAGAPSRASGAGPSELRTLNAPTLSGAASASAPASMGIQPQSRNVYTSRTLRRAEASSPLSTQSAREDGEAPAPAVPDEAQAQSAGAEAEQHATAAQEDDDADWAFGGGDMSRSGPGGPSAGAALRFGTGLHNAPPQTGAASLDSSPPPAALAYTSDDASATSTAAPASSSTPASASSPAAATPASAIILRARAPCRANRRLCGRADGCAQAGGAEGPAQRGSGRRARTTGGGTRIKPKQAASSPLRAALHARRARRGSRPWADGGASGPGDSEETDSTPRLRMCFRTDSTLALRGRCRSTHTSRALPLPSTRATLSGPAPPRPCRACSAQRASAATCPLDAEAEEDGADHAGPGALMRKLAEC